MAEVNTDKGGDGGKNKQKKKTLRVDFTPMVDMNMLLITFFMFCTSLSKPQTMEINMPSKDTTDKPDLVRESSAVTIILGGENKVYYYLGMLETEKYDDPTFLKESDYTADGIRALLLERNAKVITDINEQKLKFQNKEITKEEFEKRSAEIKKEAATKITTPTVMIKPSDESNYNNLIDILDEMQICSIAAYAIIEMQDGDKYLMYKKTGDPVYAVDLPVDPKAKK